MRIKLLFAALLAFAAPALAADYGPPPYQPTQKVSGKIRFYGFALGGVLAKWQEAFRKIHPDVTFENTLPTSDAAFPGLVTYQADLAPNGGEPAITEALSFFETRGYPASQVVVASGSFDVEGRSNGPVIFVHKDNPLTALTIDQLDGIFGSERSGGLFGFEWSVKGARGPEKNIRTLDQLGWKGAWAKQPIQTYGHGPSGTSRFFQLNVLNGTDKWNPNYRGYVETGSKQIPLDERAESKLGAKAMLAELARNKTGIAWSIMSQAKGIVGIKPLALAPRGGGLAITPSLQSFQDRSYPLVRNIYIYFDRKPGTALDPKLAEFLRFALSREGQLLVSQGNYLPLPSAMAAAQREKLN
jgi:phosphate transport system substrate-binding protein